MDKYQDKYRIPSARLQHWDYRHQGCYFVTICTKDRVSYFGEINSITQKMELSCVGVIADILWQEIKNHTKNIKLGEFVVMPNHIHGILIIDPDENKPNASVETLHATSVPSMSANNIQDVTKNKLNASVETLHATSVPSMSANNIQDVTKNKPNASVETLHATSLPSHAKKESFYSKISPESGSIATIIRSYKSAVTRHSRRLGYDFQWQSRFYDHIIRDANSYEKIANYIVNNPLTWKKDTYF